MSAWVHDILAVCLALAGLAVLLGFTKADQAVGWVLLGSAGIPIATGLVSRGKPPPV